MAIERSMSTLSKGSRLTLKAFGCFWMSFLMGLTVTAAEIRNLSLASPEVHSTSQNGTSCNPILSPDGRYVLFASSALNLLTGSTNGEGLEGASGKLNVFLRDRNVSQTVLISSDCSSRGGSDGDCFPESMSPDGRYVLFESEGRNLVPGVTNGFSAVFLRDVLRGKTVLVSANTNGLGANGRSYESVMTPDARYVAFASSATDLVLGDTNGIPDIFVRDLLSNSTVVASSGAVAGSIYGRPYASQFPEITPDGRYVAFSSTASNLVPLLPVIAFAHTRSEVYLRDLWMNHTELVSTNVRSLFPSRSAICLSGNHVMSTNGQFVTFRTIVDARGTQMIMRRDLAAGVTDVIYSNNPNSFSMTKQVQNLDMTPDGQVVVFLAVSGSGKQVYAWDAQNRNISVVSADRNGAEPTNAVCDFPVLDATGHLAAFLSDATNLTTNIVSTGFHLYLRDLLSSTTVLLDVGTNERASTLAFLNALAGDN
jgi:Tol biopolymer transport system component